jgi:hypothetical protein
MGINKYRGLCRTLIYACRHPELTSARKNVLLALVDSVNDEEDYTAWPSFDGLAARTGVDRRTAIRAINIGRKLGLLQRIYKGGIKVGRNYTNRYRFLVDVVTGQTLRHNVTDGDEVSGETSRGVTPVLDEVSRQTPYNLRDNLRDNLREAPPSSSFGNSDVVALEDSSKKERKGVGERGPEGPKSEPRPPDQSKRPTRPSYEELMAEFELEKLMGRDHVAKKRKLADLSRRLERFRPPPIETLDRSPTQFDEKALNLWP